MRSRLALGYVALLHLLLGVLLLHADVPEKVAIRAGLLSEPDHPFIATMRQLHARLDATVAPGAVVFLGDSNTQSMPVWEVSPRAVNYGIGWQRSDQLAASMSVYRSLRHASAVVVMIGTNDLQAGALPQYARVLRSVPNKPRILLVIPPPLRGVDMAATAQAARAACGSDARCVLVDGYSALAGRADAILPDGVHLSAGGYAVLVSLIRQALHHTTVTPSAA